MKGKSPNHGKGSATTRRSETVRVKTAKGRKISSILWLERQLNDPYVRAAKVEGYRSRAAYKLLQLHEKYKLLKPGMRVVDIGAAPGGWTQVVAEKINLEAGGKAQLVAIDLLKMDELPGTVIFQDDFTGEGVADKIKAILGGPVDLVLSDMAAEGTGHKSTDHIRIMMLAEEALAFTQEVMGKGGAFVCKLFQGGGEGEFMKTLRANFQQVHFSKPPASRAGAETYVVAKGFKGR